MKIKLPEKMARSINRMGFKFKKASPEILVIGGVIGVLGSIVMACRATTKVDEVLEPYKEIIDEIHSEMDDEILSEKHTQKDLTITYTQMIVNVGKLYIPAAIVLTGSLTAILTSNQILRSRGAALTAAYSAISKGFKSYRENVVDRFGEDVDKELRYGIKAVESEETTVDSKGKEKTKKITQTIIDPNTYSDYARIFDDGNLGWTKNAEDNLLFLKQQQAYANEKLQDKGFLFLNDVYEMLGFPRCKMGQIVGWIYDEKNPIGDNFVDFGIYCLDNPKAADFVNGYERSIILDFNVDGDILDEL